MNPRVHDVLSMELQVAVTCTYYLAATSEYRTFRNLFGMAKSTVCECVKGYARRLWTNCLVSMCRSL